MKKIIQLEEETAMMEAADGDELEEEMTSFREKQALVTDLHRRISQKRLENRKKKYRNGPNMPRRGRSVGEVETRLKSLNYETEGVRGRSRSVKRQPLSVNRDELRDKKRKHSATKMDVDDDGASQTPAKRLRALTLPRRNRSASRVPNRNEQGMPREQDRKKVERTAKRGMHSRDIRGMKGEGDRFIGTAKPKHLFAGKRGIGKTTRR